MPSKTAPPLPSSFLPTLRALSSLSTPALALILKNLTDLYAIHHTRVYHATIDSGYASDADEVADEEDGDEPWQIVRADAFEKAHAIRWMTGFVARSYEWIAIPEEEEEVEDRETIADAISALLAACAQTSEAGDLDREFRFSSSQLAVTVLLKDGSLSTTDHTSVGMQTWGSSAVLAQRIVDNPTLYGIPTSSSRPLRVLELGAGTGLLSLVFSNILIERGITAHIVATDFHPSVLSNLQSNICHNRTSPIVTIAVAPLDWQQVYEDPTAEFSFADEPFDVILAADVVYRSEHADWIAATVRRFLRKPDPNHDSPSFHLIAPIRPTHENTRSSIEKAFPANSSAGELYTVRMTDSAKEKKSVGRADESSYREYTVQWS